MGHVADIVHPRADQEFGASRRRHLQKENDFLRQVLAVAVEDRDVGEAAVEPVAQAGLDRFAFAAVLFVDNDFGPAVARGLRGRIGRTVIDDKNVIELLERSARHVADMFLFEVSGNDRGDGRAIDCSGVWALRHFQRTTGWKSAA